MLGLSFISAGLPAPAGRRTPRAVRVLRLLIPALMAFWLAPNLSAQAQTETQAQLDAQGQSDTQSQVDAALADSQPISPVPVFSAGLAYNTFFQSGTAHLHPLVSPVVLIPLGQNWLIESRDTFEIDMAPQPGENGYKGYLQKEVDYLQLDYIVNSHVTVTVGRFLTPFGIFNERLYPVWIRNLQTDPLILPISTGPSGAGTGAMVRGGFNIAPKVEINYATYFSTLSTYTPLDSYREIGVRSGIYLPGPRLEVGGSYQHLLQDDHSNAFGFHFAWQPPALPLDIRSEYARSENGSGYWTELAYRLSDAPAWRHELRHVQVVGRMQQFYVGKVPNGVLPSVNTNMFEFGVNYYFRDDFRLVSSYGRQFAPQGGNMNVWNLGVTYRLALPVGHGDIQ
jgi:hypothetical protein